MFFFILSGCNVYHTNIFSNELPNSKSGALEYLSFTSMIKQLQELDNRMIANLVVFYIVNVTYQSPNPGVQLL